MSQKFQKQYRIYKAIHCNENKSTYHFFYSSAITKMTRQSGKFVQQGVHNTFRKFRYVVNIEYYQFLHDI